MPPKQIDPNRIDETIQRNHKKGAIATHYNAETGIRSHITKIIPWGNRDEVQAMVDRCAAKLQTEYNENTAGE